MSTPPTTLIINADDFGFSPGITDGILQCHLEGILTSTTLMATMPDRDRAIALALQTPTLGVGIHLCLTQGTPLTRCEKILNSDGSFPRSLPKLFLRLQNRTARQQAQAEWSAQIGYALQKGLRPTHLDSHKHIHHLPALHDIVMAVAEEYQIPFLRAAQEITPPTLPTPALPYRLLARQAKSLAAKLPAHGLRTTDWFFGLATTGRTDSAIWTSLLQHLPPGLGEIMVHPGNPIGLVPADTRLLQQRTVEQNALLDPQIKFLLQSGGVQRKHYGQIILPP